jgi:hypothetical protein
MAFHGFPKEFEGCIAIKALLNEAFQDLPFVIHGAPKIVRLAVDLHEHLIQVPSPIRTCAHLANPFLANLCGRQRDKAVQPKSNRLIADVYATFVQRILHIPKRKREADVHYHGQTDDLGGSSWSSEKGERFVTHKS